MKDSLITALESMLALQRWNFLPRLEMWVEAENACYVTHLAYALGRTSGLTADQLQCVLMRALLKSLNKHSLTDIAVSVRDKLKLKNAAAWTALIDSTAANTSALFPRLISKRLCSYLTDTPGYQQDNNNESVDVLEQLVKYAQLQAAIQECSRNAIAYPEDYKSILADLKRKVKPLEQQHGWGKLMLKHEDYFRTLCRLKYLRRWNRINRILSSSVMGHTYVVCILAVSFAMLSEHEHQSGEQGRTEEHFIYRSILRALFHDVPESLTGDIITPVKDAISKQDSDLIANVEAALTTEFLKTAPAGVQQDVAQYKLLAELSNANTLSIESLVKDCDRVALILECIYERGSGICTPEIESGFLRHHRELSRSEWSAIREFVNVAANYWYEMRR